MNFGLSSREFAALSMPELSALQLVYAEERKRADWRTAVIVCTLLNLHRTKESQPLQRPEDVMPWLAEPQTPRQMRAILAAVTLEMGGVIHQRPKPEKSSKGKGKRK